LKQRNTRRRIKVKKDETYSLSLDEWPGWLLAMQEQRGSTTDWGCVHTHLWIRFKPIPDLPHALFEFAWNNWCLWPNKLLGIGLVIAYEVEKDDGFSYDWGEEVYEMELILKRKISQKMVNETANWLSWLIEDFYLYLGFVGLYGKS